VNRISAIVTRFAALTAAYASSGQDTPMVQQDETAPPWRALDWLATVALTLLAATLNFVRLPPFSQLDLYYATAVKSMTMSWSNFFFVSFDPGGFVSVDKPPLGLWSQTLSVKIFGFNSFSLVLPQAIAGTLSVVVLFIIVRRVFGLLAGLIAGALLAILPINVVANRSNIFESLVVLTSLLATWAVVRATEQGSLRWLLAGGLLVGLGFNIKMLEAWLVLPACLAVYALAAPIPLRRRLIHLALFLLTLTVISLCWIETVDHIPPSQRPWVDSTLTNSEADLALNYNGLQRLAGQPAYGDKPQEPSPGTGEPGLFRLLQAPLGPQASWFLPLALIGLLTLNWGAIRRRWGASPSVVRGSRQANILFWGIWLATNLVFFSVARFFNPYYLAILAPAVCALAGIGAVGLWRAYRAPEWRGWLLPIAVISAGVADLYWLNSVSGWQSWLTPVTAGVATAVTLLLVEQRRARLRSDNDTPRTVRSGVIESGAALSVALALLLAPTAWLAGSYGKNNSGWFPVSGPGATGSAFGPAPANTRLIAYLRAHHGHERMLAATVDAFDAIPIILATGQPVMAMGGYSKYDPILAPHSLAQAVVNGEVRYFLLPTSNLTPDQTRALYPDDPASESYQTQYTNALTRWVSGACQPVPPQEWSAHSAPEVLQLFDCGARATSFKAPESG
jgi:4-amino-4-deoxy-L-arabinose transferase-like glycosyltransferase